MISMRFSLRWLLFVVFVLAVLFATLNDRASKQCSAVDQLLKHDSVTIYFSDDVEIDSTFHEIERNHYLHTVTGVLIDVTFDEVTELIPLIGKLPGLEEIYINYQGDYESVKRKCEELKKAFPGISFETNEYFLKFPVVG